MINVIRDKLQKARENRDSLEEEYQEVEDKLRELERELSKTEGEIGILLDLLKTAGVVDSNGNVDNVLELSKDKINEASKKPRADRATKEDMKKRLFAVGKIFLENGNLSIKALGPLLKEMLGYELESHRRRGILSSDGTSHLFEKKEEHGIWGLSAEGKAYFESSDLEDDSME